MAPRARQPTLVLLLLCATLYILVADATTGTNVGLTFDVCSAANPAFCKAPRQCKTSADGNIVTCTASSTCFCVPSTLKSCSKSSDCENLEQCATSTASGRAVCISCAAVRQFSTVFTQVDECRSIITGAAVPDASQASVTTTPRPSPSAGSSTSSASSQEGLGFTMDNCKGDDDCSSPRECFHIISTVTVASCTSSSPQCNCLPASKVPNECSNQVGCPSEQEVCAKLPIQNQFHCFSEQFVNKFFPNAMIAPTTGFADNSVPPPGAPLINAVTGDGIEKTKKDCVATHHLLHLPPHKLVYGSAHRRADVLCDAANNCATAPHVVIFHDMPMTMRQYCQRVRCTTKANALVNSPAIQRGLRVASNTPGLTFTVFAARFETAIERGIIRALLAAGF